MQPPKTCTICGDPFKPLSPQAYDREICYERGCERERTRRNGGKRHEAKARLMGWTIKGRKTLCARCDMPAHEGKTCREVA